MLNGDEVEESEVEDGRDEENGEEDVRPAFEEEVGEVEHFVFEKIASSLNWMKIKIKTRKGLNYLRF